MKVRKLTELALLTALALIIFIVELRIPNPIPIPGVKLGLANVITVYAVYHYRAKEVFLIVLVRILVGSIFGGNMMALLYSLAGGMLCLAGMLLLRKVIAEKYIWLCSVFGAVLHNIGQITVAILITGTPALIAYLPFLLVSGCAAGAFTGGCAQFILKRSKEIHLNTEN
jgi:heptaprenyl diphosphate synthase component I